MEGWRSAGNADIKFLSGRALTVEQIVALVEFRDRLLDVRKAKEASRAGRVDAAA
jgi:hypothetical protein